AAHPEWEQQRGQDEGIGVDDPGHPRLTGVEVGVDLGQSDIDDRHIEEDEEVSGAQAEDERSGHPPASFVSSLSGQGRHRRYRAPRCVSRFRRTSPSVPAKARPRVCLWQSHWPAEVPKQRRSVEATARTPLSRRSTVASAKCRRKTSRPRAVSVSQDRKSTRLNSSHVSISYAV